MKIKYIAYCVSSLLVLSACAGSKGNFDTIMPTHTNTEKPVVTPKTQTDDTSNPRPKEPELQSKLQEAGLGFAIKIPVRNAHPYNQEDEAKLSSDQLEILNDSSLNIPHYDELLANSSEGWVSHTHDKYGETHKRDFEYVRSGYVQDLYAKSVINVDDKIFKRGPNGYVYYRGVNPATHLPTKTVHYRGVWDFVTNAVKGRERGSFSDSPNIRAGDLFGATSAHEPVQNKNVNNPSTNQPYPIGHSSEFEVDFANKTLRGRLVKNGEVRNGYQELTERYTLDAKLYGNRFRGNAKASNANDLYFGKDSNEVEGGFFGEHAEEMAGKFMTNDNSLFAVFAAKQTGDKAATQAAFDGEKIEVGHDKGAVHLSQNRLDTFGNATKLVVDGRVFSLLPNDSVKDFATFMKYSFADNRDLNVNVCCSNLDYVKFGNYFFANNGINNKDYAYFIMGERTPESVVARQNGKVQYLGAWEGILATRDGLSTWVTGAESSANKSSRAVLNFDFGAKTFDGGLYAPNGVSPVLSLNGVIERNGFSGKANTSKEGFNLDSGSTGSSAVVNIHADVRGGFYGPNAQEVGGTVIANQSNQDKTAVVFGAKRQVIK